MANSLANLARSRCFRVGTASPLGLLLAALATVSLPATPAAAATTRPFAASSPFNVPIKTAPRLDPASAAMVARVAGSARPMRTSTRTASRSTARPRRPRATRSRARWRVQWGHCPLVGPPMPIPDHAKPSTGTDGAMVVIEPNGSIGEYWQAARTGTGWTASWGADQLADPAPDGAAPAPARGRPGWAGWFGSARSRRG